MNNLKTVLFTLAFFICMGVNAQNWGIGARLGDPSGITIKKYMSKSAFEINVGRTYGLYGRGYYDRYYDRRFNDWYPEQNFGYSEIRYRGFRRYNPISVQLHYLLSKPTKNVAGLEWYAGFGAQLRFQQYYYDYQYRRPGDNTWYYSSDQRMTDFDLGVDGVLGLEYKFKELPIAVFLDVTLFMEIFDDPFMFRFQGGTGVRYLF